MHAAWWMLGALAVLAIAYRYYSAFLAAKVLCLDDAKVTPAHTLEDGQNFHPTNRVVTVIDPAPSPTSRFYRVATPQQP